MLCEWNELHKIWIAQIFLSSSLHFHFDHTEVAKVSDREREQSEREKVQMKLTAGKSETFMFRL